MREALFEEIRRRCIQSIDHQVFLSQVFLKENERSQKPSVNTSTGPEQGVATQPCRICGTFCDSQKRHKTLGLSRERLISSVLEEEFPSEELVKAGVTWDAITGIVSQELQKRARIRMKEERENASLYVNGFQSGTSLVHLATSRSFSPYLAARMVVERLVMDQNVETNKNKRKKALSSFVRNPHEIPCKALALQVSECADLDPCFSPFFDRLRETIGLEYEYILQRKLATLGVSFQTESELRKLGMSKTPDVRLDVPVGVVGPNGEPRVICWVDSKAMFGDPASHKHNLQQLEGYVNRFGPGMVIYWSGFVDELNNDAMILLCDHFPEDFTTHAQ